MPIGPQAISAEIANRQTSDVWHLFLGQVRTLQPFWSACIHHFSFLTGLNTEKATSHLSSASVAFDRMDDWRFARAKQLKVRRNEIDSAISFVRNAALQQPVSSLSAAASARNAASALRTALTASCHGYRDNQLPELLAHAIFDVAAVRVRFPFDFGTLASLDLGNTEGGSADDPFIVMVEKVAKLTDRTKEAQDLFHEVEHLYAHIERPQTISNMDWFTEVDDSNVRMYYASQTAFHSR